MQPHLKRTSSEIYEDRSDPYMDRSHQIIESVKLPHKLNRSKLPDFMERTLKANSSHIKGEIKQQKEIKLSRIGSIMKSKVKEWQKLIECQVCGSQFKKSDNSIYISECQHKFEFCESCLHHYAIYKIKQFEEVFCPRQGCNKIMSTSTSFFKNLPIDIQRNYKKINRFYTAAKNQNIKMCPKQDCEGFIELNGETTMLCNLCTSGFCSKCFLEKHEGECQKHQLMFFQGILHYRQCKKCKMVIEKNQGCNHITCRCSYQFCYVCGADWDPAHYGQHDDKGNLVQGGANAANGNGCCECECLDTGCGSILKDVIGLIRLLFVLVIYVCKDLMIFAGIIFLTVVCALIVYPVEFLSSVDCPGLLILMLLYPIPIVMNFPKVMSEILCEGMEQHCSSMRESYRSLLGC